MSRLKLPGIPDPTADIKPHVIDLFNHNNPRSLINILPERFGQKVLGHKVKDSFLFKLDEHTLASHLKKNHSTPNATDHRLRMKFWIEYDRCQTVMDPQMYMHHVFGNTITHECWNYFCENTKKIAWLICPPHEYAASTQEILTFGIEELRAIMGKSHEDAKGNIDINLARLKLSIFKHFDERVNGQATQKSISVNLTERRDVLAAQGGATSDSLQARLKQLERQEREALHLPDSLSQAKQITPTVIDVNKKSGDE